MFPSFIYVYLSLSLLSDEEVGNNGLLARWSRDVHIDQANQQCFPLYSYLAALDNPTVNLLSLDIEVRPALIINNQSDNVIIFDI